MDLEVLVEVFGVGEGEVGWGGEDNFGVVLAESRELPGG